MSPVSVPAPPLMLNACTLRNNPVLNWRKAALGLYESKLLAAGITDARHAFQFFATAGDTSPFEHTVCFTSDPNATDAADVSMDFGQQQNDDPAAEEQEQGVEEEEEEDEEAWRYYDSDEEGMERQECCITAFTIEDFQLAVAQVGHQAGEGRAGAGRAGPAGLGSAHVVPLLSLSILSLSLLSPLQLGLTGDNSIGLTEVEVAELMQGADTDGDGWVDFNEFQDMFQQPTWDSRVDTLKQSMAASLADSLAAASAAAAAPGSAASASAPAAAAGAAAVSAGAAPSAASPSAASSQEQQKQRRWEEKEQAVLQGGQPYWESRRGLNVEGEAGQGNNRCRDGSGAADAGGAAVGGAVGASVDAAGADAAKEVTGGAASVQAGDEQVEECEIDVGNGGLSLAVVKASLFPPEMEEGRWPEDYTLPTHTSMAGAAGGGAGGRGGSARGGSALAQELLLYVCSAGISALVLLFTFRQLDPNRAQAKLAKQRKREIAKRLGRPMTQLDPNRAQAKLAKQRKREIAKRLGRPYIETNTYEVEIAKQLGRFHPSPSLSTPIYPSPSFSTHQDVIANDVINSQDIHVTLDSFPLSTLLHPSVPLSTPFQPFISSSSGRDSQRRDQPTGHPRHLGLHRLCDGLQHVKESRHDLDVIANDVINPQDIHVTFDSIGGLQHVKESLHDLVILPLQRPELFAQGRLLRPQKGVLLFGPPGTGKTLLAKAIAKECRAVFINVRIANLMSKWFGDAQKLVTAVFTLAHKLQPAIIFIDEVESFLGQRRNTEHEAVTSMKTEFMSLWDGFSTDDTARVMVLAATNRPWELDEAILRRLPRHFEIPLPDLAGRTSILEVILRDEDVDEDLDLQEIASLCAGYSGSDLTELCKQAAYLPLHDFLEEERRALQGKGKVRGEGQGERGRARSPPPSSHSPWQTSCEFSASPGNNPPHYIMLHFVSHPIPLPAPSLLPSPQQDPTSQRPLARADFLRVLSESRPSRDAAFDYLRKRSSSSASLPHLGEDPNPTAATTNGTAFPSYPHANGGALTPPMAAAGGASQAAQQADLMRLLFQAAMASALQPQAMPQQQGLQAQGMQAQGGEQQGVPQQALHSHGEDSGFGNNAPAGAAGAAPADDAIGAVGGGLGISDASGDDSGLLALTLGASDSCEELLSSSLPHLSKLARAAGCAATRVACLDAMAIITFVGAMDAHATEESMGLLWLVANPQGASKAVVPAAVRGSAISNWTLLLSTLPSSQLSQFHTRSELEVLSRCLQDADLGVRGAAGEAIALVHEHCPADAADEAGSGAGSGGGSANGLANGGVESSDSDDSIVDGVVLPDKPVGGGRQGSATVQRAVEQMQQLTVGSSKQMTKKDRLSQRLAFREILGSIRDNGRCSETVIRLKHGDSLRVDTWTLTVQLNALRRFLADGFQRHLQENELLHQVFSYQPRMEKKEVFQTAVQKRMILSPNSEASRNRSVARRRSRLAAQ
ncbi:unnamed protein product, partial [Closterium sp. NIES-53]